MTREIKAFSIVSGWHYKTLNLEDFGKIYYKAVTDKPFEFISPRCEYYAGVTEDDSDIDGFIVFVGSLALLSGEIIFCEGLVDILGLYKTLGLVEKRELLLCEYCTFFNAESVGGECRLNPPALDANGFYSYPYTEKKRSCSRGQYTPV
jgi:hypothetical protein